MCGTGTGLTTLISFTSLFLCERINASFISTVSLHTAEVTGHRVFVSLSAVSRRNSGTLFTGSLNWITLSIHVSTETWLAVFTERSESPRYWFFFFFFFWIGNYFCKFLTGAALPLIPVSSVKWASVMKAIGGKQMGKTKYWWGSCFLLCCRSLYFTVILTCPFLWIQK